MKHKTPYEKEKKDHKIGVSVTGEEYIEVVEKCHNLGGISMGQYFRMLHLKAMGRLKEGGAS
jgi:hypothetical protein